nr:MAG TPA: hypothetical protein [Caudoviricetes sp.]
MRSIGYSDAACLLAALGYQRKYTTKIRVWKYSKKSTTRQCSYRKSVCEELMLYTIWLQIGTIESNTY